MTSGATTAALIAVSVLGMWFSATRGVAIAAVAVLTLMFPWLVVVILVGSCASFYLFHIRKQPRK